MVIKELFHRILTDIKVDKVNNEIIFTRDDGKQFRMYHSQDCCESVTIDDIIGDINDLIGYPLHMADEETSNLAEPTRDDEDDYSVESCTWTFYKFATIKGYVTIRWYAQSNGYYSESVYISEINETEEDEFEL